MSKTIIAVALDGRESLETAVKTSAQEYYYMRTLYIRTKERVRTWHGEPALLLLWFINSLTWLLITRGSSLEMSNSVYIVSGSDRSYFLFAFACTTDTLNEQK